MLSSLALSSLNAPLFRRRRFEGAHKLSSSRLLRHTAALKLPGCSPGVQGISVELLESTSDAVEFNQLNNVNISPRDQEEDVVGDEEAGLNRTRKNDDDEEEEAGISRIAIPRQRYIAVSKAELQDAIVSKLFGSEDDEDARQFLLLCACLDSILHAEHKSILEEMRTDYVSAHSMEDHEVSEKSLNSSERGVDDAGKSDEYATINGYGDEIPLDWLGRFNYGIDLSNLLSSNKTGKSDSNGKSRLAVDTRFQRAFMQLLNDAQFEELSARDLMLTSALNTDYLLTLPIYVDWKRASESNAIIFRRGYTAERQKGLLIVEKLDYLQSKFLRGIFSIASKPLGKVGKWISKALIHASETGEGKFWINRLRLWLEELSLFQQSQNFDSLTGADELSVSELPMWLAAQRAVSRYEGFLSSTGPRGRLLRKLISWIGLIPSTSETPFHLDTDNNSSEPYLRTNFLSRISLGDIWRPATRKYCGNDIWKFFKTSISILLSKTTLQEPAFKELILLYTEDVSGRDVSHSSGVQPLQLKIYQKIPIPDLPVIFPHKKLSFRIIDTVRLDVATILGLLAFLINYKFEDISSSPSAIYLDVLAVSALIIYVTRVALGYKQTWDRYQLLVNKTLYEKTLASGFGSVHFLLDASEQQQYKEAILTYAVLLKAENGLAISQKRAGDECERFMHDVVKQKVEMPVDKAVNTLVRLGLVTEIPAADGNGSRVLRAIPCSRAYEALRNRWNSLLM